MPDLLDIQDGTSVFVDTNIFHYHFQNESRTCTAFLDRIKRGDVEAYVNAQVLSDLLHKLMLSESFEKKCYTAKKPNQDSLKNYLRNLHNNPSEISKLTDYQQQFESILSIGVRILPINKTLLRTTKYERQTWHLMAGDSIHLGTMNRYKIPIQHIATHDNDFDHIPGLTIWKPLDIPRPVPTKQKNHAHP